MLLLRRARVPATLLPAALVPSRPDPLEPTVLCDVGLAGETVVSVAPASSAPAGTAEIDAGGALVFPGFIDAHVHLDKTHTWHRAPNRSGTFWEAITSLAGDKDNWTEADLLRRAGFALRTAFAHGTRVIRTHLDTGLPWAEVSHATMADLRAEWAGRIDLQTIPLCGGADFLTDNGRQIAALARRYGATSLGGFLQMNPDLPAQVDGLLRLAQDHGMGIDLHVDENDNPAAECLRHVAEGVLRNRFTLPVVCGHCCSLAVQPRDRARSTIDVVKAAGIGIISLPLCNVYLQDRRSTGTAFPRTPLWRGLTLVHDLLDAGVPVACASDNVRDAFHAFGDYDAAEVLIQSVRLAHLDGRLDAAVNAVTRSAADLVGLPTFGRIAPGSPAHLVVFGVQRFSELLSRPGNARRLVNAGGFVSAPLPDYGELLDR